MALSEDTQAKVDRLGKNQRAVLDSLARANYPGGGWIWSNHSETVKICESLVRRDLVTEREVRGVTLAANYTVYEAIPEIVEDYREKERERSARRRAEDAARSAAVERGRQETAAHKAATDALIERHPSEFRTLLAAFRAEYGVAQSV